MTILAVSPHLDDAAFSAGGALATAVADGHTVVVATVFTRSVPDPTGFALACQTDKGLGPDADYMAVRRAEDADACARIGAVPVWLDLPEAPHRGYGSAEALFDGAHDDDRGTWEDVRDALAPVLRERRPGLVLSCQGLGGHVDHLHTARAVAALTHSSPEVTSWWRDQPYALRGDAAAPAPGLPGGLREVGLPLTVEALTVKLDGCAAYASQLPYQFARDADGADGGPAEAMRQRLAAFARSEGARFGFRLPAEAFATGHPDAWNRLWDVSPLR